MSIKNSFDQQFNAPVCGIDEVGRGPLAGPVVSSCVFIPADVLDNPIWAEITDSKKISQIKREKLFEPIKELCFYGIAEASHQEIDQLNIHHATLLAMKRAYEAMKVTLPPSFRRRSESCGLSQKDSDLRRNDKDDKNVTTDESGRQDGGKGCEKELIALIDGKFAPQIDCATQTVIKGDTLSLSIGAASIIAKVTRDRMMSDLHDKYPHYGWNSNAGYGTKTHMEGLQTFGLTPFHRLSFAPCAAVKDKESKRHCEEQSDAVIQKSTS